MRIISGSLKGREIVGYDIDGTRPTQDRVKESIFSMIQSDIRDSVVLDLFAGSGNLGLEAISNYCKYCYFVDKNKVAVDTIKKNIIKFKIEDAKVLNIDYKKALDYFKEEQIKFNVVFLDPPYNMKIQEDIIKYIIDNDLLNDEGIIISEYEDGLDLSSYKDLSLEKNKKYGKKIVKIYRRNK